MNERVIETEKAFYWVNDRDEVTKIINKDRRRSVFNKCLDHRLINNRDCKTIVTSRNNSTGLGKTTLARILAEDRHRFNKRVLGLNPEWDYEKLTFIDGWEYSDYYRNEAEKGDAVVLDELQIIMDNRRSQTGRQVELSHDNQKLRFKNVYTFATAPGLHRVDLRIPRDYDFWINIVVPGIAYVYFLGTNDFTGEHNYQKLRFFGRTERLIFSPLKNDEAKEYLDELKGEYDINQNQAESEGFSRGEFNEGIRYQREQQLKYLLKYKEEYNPPGLTQSAIASMIPKHPETNETMGQAWVSRKSQEFGYSHVWK